MLCRWNWNLYQWFFLQLLTTGILAVKFFLSKNTSTHILFIVEIFCLAFHRQTFCCKTYRRLPFCRWTCYRLTFYYKAICNQTFGIQIAFEQLLAIRLFVVRILSRIISVGIFKDRLSALEFLTFFSRLIFSSQNLLHDFSRSLTFCVCFFLCKTFALRLFANGFFL